MDKIREGKEIQTLEVRRNPEITQRRMIEQVIENFDFVKCHVAMKALRWEWFGVGIPTIEQLKRASIDRLESAIELAKKNKCHKSTFFSSSGGLKGNAWVNRYGHVEAIRLEFVLTDWDADGDV